MEAMERDQIMFAAPFQREQIAGRWRFSSQLIAGRFSGGYDLSKLDEYSSIHN
jgi:hypothetical protein